MSRPDFNVQMLDVRTTEKAFSGSGGMCQAGTPGCWVDIHSHDNVTISVEFTWQGGKYVAEDVKPSETRKLVLPELLGQSVKLCRWRPGAFGQNGTGGGDAHVTIPSDKATVLTLHMQVS